MTDDQREAHKLKPCFCGETPEQLSIQPIDPLNDGRSKYAYCFCGTCGEWSVEFRADYKNDDEMYDLAVKTWNNAPRATDD